MAQQKDIGGELGARLQIVRDERDAARRKRLHSSKLDAYRGEIVRLLAEQHITAPELVAVMNGAGVKISVSCARRFLRALVEEVRA